MEQSSKPRARRVVALHDGASACRRGGRARRPPPPTATPTPSVDVDYRSKAQMEDCGAQPTEEGKDPKTLVEVVAHVLPKSTFLRNVGLQSIEMKRNAKAAAMNDRVHDLDSMRVNWKLRRWDQQDAKC